MSKSKVVNKHARGRVLPTEQRAKAKAAEKKAPATPKKATTVQPKKESFRSQVVKSHAHKTHTQRVQDSKTKPGPGRGR